MTTTDNAYRTSLLLAVLSLASCSSSKTLSPGEQWTLTKTTQLSSLTIGPAAHLAASNGRELTLTVDGVEEDFNPGTYTGDVFVTVTDPYRVKFVSPVAPSESDYQFRQAIFLGPWGIEADRSVLAAAGKYSYQDGLLRNVTIKSDGQDFNGIVVTGGRHTVSSPAINFRGDGGNDFAGYGAAVLALGRDTTLFIDGGDIHTQGVVRTGIVADQGSNLIVSNSRIESHDGVLSSDYIPNVTPGQMKAVPWMLGLAGNVRTTNLTGVGTRATYIASSISSDRWGVLSIDNGPHTDARLVTINSEVRNLADSGYGSYAIGDSHSAFLGTRFDVADYAEIIAGGDAVFAASSRKAIVTVNEENKIGLAPQQMDALPQRESTVKSGRFGVMWHGDGSVVIQDGTVFETGETAFLDKGGGAKLLVDGSRGARVVARNGVLVQIMDDDDPGPVTTNGLAVNSGVYHDPAGIPKKSADFDNTNPHNGDAEITFSNISLAGDLFNSVRGSNKGGKNMIVSLNHASLRGGISASTAKHVKETIAAPDYKLLGEVTNTVSEPVNNGVLVWLNKSTWTVTHSSYLTALITDADSTIRTDVGSRLTLFVNNRALPVKPGVYKGIILLKVSNP